MSLGEPDMQAHQVIITTSPSTNVLLFGESIPFCFWGTFPHTLVSAEGVVLLPTVTELVDATGHEDNCLLHLAL